MLLCMRVKHIKTDFIHNSFDPTGNRNKKKVHKKSLFEPKQQKQRMNCSK